MAMKSFWWTAPGAPGDGAEKYTRSDLSKIVMVLAGGDGITPGYLDELEGSVPAGNTVRIATGAVVVDGKPAIAEVAEDINIPSSVGAGNTRIDRIVARADWDAQTVRLHRLAGVDAASPVPPDLTQQSGVCYDLPLYQVQVNTSGAVTLLVDERLFRRTTDRGLRAGAPTSIIGRAAGTAGDVTDIAAETDNRLLGRVSGALGWVQLTLGMIPDLLITGAKIAAGAITTEKIANGAVTASKLATGARQFTINVPIGNGQEVVSAGFYGYYRLPQYPFRILSWEIGSDVSGSIQFDLWVDSYAAFPPTAADSICGSAKPTLSNAAKASGSASGWSGGGQVAGNRWLGVNVVSASGVKLVTLALICEG